MSIDCWCTWFVWWLVFGSLSFFVWSVSLSSSEKSCSTKLTARESNKTNLFRDLFRWHCRDVLHNPTKHWKGKRFWIRTFDVRGRVAEFECRFVVEVGLLVVGFVAMRWIRMVNHWFIIEGWIGVGAEQGRFDEAREGRRACGGGDFGWSRRKCLLRLWWICVVWGLHYYPLPYNCPWFNLTLRHHKSWLQNSTYSTIHHLHLINELRARRKRCWQQCSIVHLDQTNQPNFLPCFFYETAISLFRFI